MNIRELKRIIEPLDDDVTVNVCYTSDAQDMNLYMPVNGAFTISSSIVGGKVENNQFQEVNTLVLAKD